MIITKTSAQIPDALLKAHGSTQSFFRVAAIQMASGPNVKGNLEEATRLIDIAASTGARIIALPEYFAIMGLKDTDKVAVREQPGDGPIQQWMSEIAARHRIWLIGGSIPMESNVPNKVRNTCLVYNKEGKQVARYDKIHLFNLALGTENYSEERTIEAGDKVVVTKGSPPMQIAPPLPTGANRRVEGGSAATTPRRRGRGQCCAQPTRPGYGETSQPEGHRIQ